MAIHLGTSGWSYDHWNGVLYPPGTPAAKRLAAYAAEFATVELNSSFYRWPRPEAFTGWHDRLPAGFLLSVKASRWLTHGRRLKDPEAWIERMVPGLRALGEHRGALLVQLPAALERDDERLEHFLAALPPDVRVAVEVRHPSWFTPPVYELLERRGAALCVVSGAGVPCDPRTTAPFAYVRWHGPDQAPTYAGSYSDAELAGWARRLAGWAAAGTDVYAYFNNDIGGHAVHDARRLRRLLADAGAPVTGGRAAPP